MPENSDQERELIKKGLMKGQQQQKSEETSIKDYKSEDKTEFIRTANDAVKVTYTEVRPTDGQISSSASTSGEGKMREKPNETTAELGEPASKEEGKSFDATSAPRIDGKQIKDVSQDLQEQTITAPREGAKKEDSTAGTA
jgi:hypothetical protein